MGAAKALVRIADPIATTALVNALDDRDPDARWAAGEGLIALGRQGVQPLLAGLLEHSDSHAFLEAAHHVCHELAKKRALAPISRPILEAIRHHEPTVWAPVAAYDALPSSGMYSGNNAYILCVLL
jgi:HEAT repeat protein